MKNLIILFTMSAFMTALCSFTSSQRIDKLIGSWKVESIVLINGKVKKGRKTITFSKDGTFISIKDNGAKMKGFWELDKKNLRIYNQPDERSEEFTIVKLTRKKMVLKDARKSYMALRVE